MALKNFTQEYNVTKASKNVVFCVAIRKTEQKHINRVNRCMEKLQDERGELLIEKAFVWVNRDVCIKGFAQTDTKENYYIGNVESLKSGKNISNGVLRALILLEGKSKEQDKSENELYLFINSAFSRVESNHIMKILEAFDELRLKIHLIKDDSNETIRPDNLEVYIKEHGGEILSMQSMLK